MNVMNMSPSDFLKIIERKDAEISRLSKLVAATNANIQVVGKQNTRLKKKCERYEQRLREHHIGKEMIEQENDFTWKTLE